MTYGERPDWVDEVSLKASELEEVRDPRERAALRKEALTDLLESVGAEYDHPEGQLAAYFEYADTVGKIDGSPDTDGKIDGSADEADVDALLMDRVEPEKLLESFEEHSYGVPEAEDIPGTYRGLVSAVETIEEHYSTDYAVIDNRDLERIDEFETEAKEEVKRVRDIARSLRHKRRISLRDLKIDIEPKEFPYSISDEEMREMTETAQVERITVKGSNMAENLGRVIEYVEQKRGKPLESDHIISLTEMEEDDFDYI